MDIFTQKRIALWTIILLVVLNVSLLTVIWIGRRPIEPRPIDAPPHSERTLELLQQELGFSDEQIRQYDLLRKEHARQTLHLITDIQRLKKEMLDEVMTGHPDSVRVSQTATAIGNLQSQIEQLTFQHFLDLKELCGENQVKQLHMLMQAFFARNPAPGQGPQPGQEGRRMPPPPLRD